MSGKLLFEIPDDQEIMAKLVEAVPSNWSWVDGWLYASDAIIASRQVEEHTGFDLQRFHSINPTITGSYDGDKGKRRKPNLLAIIVDQKLPGFIKFDEAGYGADIVTLELAKRIAISFLRKGYRGGLHFYSGCYDNSKYSNPARCSLIFEPWDGAPIEREEAGAQPARVKLEWESRYRGKEETIAPIVAVCRAFNLCEYTPAASAGAATF
jgi:hypothetical protein